MANKNFKVRNGLDIGDGLSISDTATFTTASNGNITLDPDGTGDIVFTLANGGNLTNTRNYVFGAVRNSTTESNGDIWALNVSSNTQPFRGINIDNSSDTTKLPAFIGRSYSNTSGFRSRLIFERARGTAASPTAVQAGDFLGEVCVTGANGSGTWINDSLSIVPGFFGFNAIENWTSNTNLGTIFNLSLAPSATTISSAANLVSCLSITPQTFASRSDAFTWANGKTGTTQTMSLDVSGNLTVTGDLTVTGNDIKKSGGTTCITFSGTNLTTLAGDLVITGNDLRNSGGNPAFTMTSDNSVTTVTGTTLTLVDSAAASLKGNKISYRRTFGCWHKVADVTAAAADTIYEFDWTNNVTPHVSTQGITISNTSRINFDTGGDYNVVIEMVGKNVDNADRTAYIWLAKNGTDISETAIKLVLTKDTTTMLAKDWLVEGLAANDYLEVRFAVDTTVSGISLEYTASQASPYVRPAVASATITITPVGA